MNGKRMEGRTKEIALGRETMTIQNKLCVLVLMLIVCALALSRCVSVTEQGGAPHEVVDEKGGEVSPTPRTDTDFVIGSCPPPDVGMSGEVNPMPRRDTGDPAAARDAAMAMVKDQLGSLPELQWEGANVTPEGLVGASTFKYTAGDWVATVSFPIVPLDLVVYSVTVDNTASGFHWEGRLDDAGQMVR